MYIHVYITLVKYYSYLYTVQYDIEHTTRVRLSVKLE